MINRLLKAIFAIAVCLNCSSFYSLACSYADGHLPKTKYGLVKETEAVLLAEPVSRDGSAVEFKIVEVLKGDFKDKVFNGYETNTSCTVISFGSDRRSLFLAPLLEQSLRSPQPKYLLFVNKGESGWEMSVVATEAMNLPINDLDSSELLRSVRHFIRISSKNDYDIEKKELGDLRKLALNRRNAKHYPKSLVSDIDDELNSPTPDKPFDYLVTLYSGSSKEQKRDVLWAFAWGRHKQAAGFIIDLLKKPIPLNYIGPISKYISETRNETILIKLARNYPELDKSQRWPLMWAMIKTADKHHLNLMMAALRSADIEEAGRLATWFVQNPNPEATEIVRSLVGKSYQEHWELSFGLAGMGDIATVEWAREFMNSSDKDRWMAFYAVACSPLEAADQLAKRVIAANNPKDITWLIQGYKESQNPNRFDRLQDIINSNNRDPEVKNWLKRTLEEMAEEGSSQAADLLKRLEK
ncbi:MAG: hypothetical protein IPG22_22510 [Acidobacteria bacterium]|nr:hypothetical protein [Acidobacteriota bacterium]